MEVSYEMQEDEVRKRSQIYHTKKLLSPTSSDTSCLSSETSFEYLTSMNTIYTNNASSTIFTNGEKHKSYSTTEVRSVIEEESGTKAEVLTEVEETGSSEFEKSDVLAESEAAGTNGFHVQGNGSSILYSLNESAGDNQMDVGSNGSSFSKSPEADVGLKYVETLLDSSFTSANLTPHDTDNAEQNIVNGKLDVSGQNESADIHLSEEPEPEVAEFDVEGVIQKQETHDLFCPNCHSCITKRVILRRRKRKIQEISKGEEASGSRPEQTGSSAASDNIVEESVPETHPPQVGGTPSGTFDAISCFSCFRFFVPSEEGFLCWRFKPKPEGVQSPDAAGMSADPGQVLAPPSEEPLPDGKGHFFPLWIVTCCQPSHTEKPVTKPGSKSPLTSTTDTQVPFIDSESPLPPSDDTTLTPEDDTLGTSELGIDTLVPPKSGTSLTPDLGTDTPVPPEAGTSLKPDHGTTSQDKPMTPIKPDSDSSLSATPTPTAPDRGDTHPLWFLTCCQPSTSEPKKPVKPDATIPPKEPSLSASDNLESIFTPSDDQPAPSPKPEPPTPTIPGPGLPPPASPKPIPPIKPYDDVITSQPETEPPTAPESAPLMPRPPKPEPPVLPTSSRPETEPLIDLEPGLPREPSRPGVSALDIIKAIVYGGLLECITSLSVITSAAGGDATTLNIVALGLANVFGGLVVLIHSLRVLKHEHTTEHYRDQLGQPGHFLLHAIVAILSYLVFGLLSPIIYGFSFRKSDNKDYKLAVLAAASLVCITVLSAAKSYVRTSHKAYMKTIFYYIGLGFMVSGLGYVAGDLINMLLKKLGVFDPKAPGSMSVLEAGALNGAWSSY